MPQAAVAETPVTTLRDRLKAGRASLARAFLEQPRPAHYLARHATLVDGVLAELMATLGLPRDCCLAAVGGYGRGELFPSSDIDVLLLIPGEPGPALRASIEHWVRACWDIGLEIGHSVRTIEACAEEAEADVTIETNLLEARIVWGDLTLFQAFRAAFDARLDAPRFFTAKIAEQMGRHRRFDDSAYKLEPNLKDSPGGLRDLHTIHWLARAAGLGDGWRNIVRAGLLNAAEAKRITKAEHWLARLRIHMHLLAVRREDRVAFDYQIELAARFGLVATPNLRADERLMQGYYRAAKLVLRVNDILLSSLRDYLQPDPTPPQIIDADFQRRGSVLQTRDPELFSRDPSALLRIFIVYAEQLRALWRDSSRIDAAFRADPVNRASFMQLLRQPHGVSHALHLMHRYGLLGRYIPAFGRIVGQMQHDLFHVYTVDEHILMVLRNMRRFTVPALAHEFPLASSLIARFEQPEVLYLAALFHDIAKGRGGDHSELGAHDARRFCRLHGLDRDPTELVAWLVEVHLVMSRTAQKEDLSDPDVIAAFVARVSDTRHLDALYMLTIADIRGTSPKVWNGWKAKLLQDLYHAARARLAGDEMAGSVEARQGEARNQLALYGLSEAAVNSLWQHLDARYFLRFDTRDIAWQVRMLWRRVDSANAVVCARLSPVGEGIQVLVYARDRADIFARICGFFARIQYSILEAKIHTTQHGYVLDSFQVMDLSQRGIHYRDFLNYVEHELALDLDPVRTPDPVPHTRLTRQQRHHPLTPVAKLYQADQADSYTLLVICADRAGLLHAIAQVFLAHAINLYAARINTLGERVEDNFSIQGSGLDTAERVAAFETEILGVLNV
jgi:[protein-PII] uridylyltransferase